MDLPRKAWSILNQKGKSLETVYSQTADEAALVVKETFSSGTSFFVEPQGTGPREKKTGYQVFHYHAADGHIQIDVINVGGGYVLGMRAGAPGSKRSARYRLPPALALFVPCGTVRSWVDAGKRETVYIDAGSSSHCPIYILLTSAKIFRKRHHPETLYSVTARAAVTGPLDTGSAQEINGTVYGFARVYRLQPAQAEHDKS